MALLHPGHQVDRLPCGTDVEAHAATVFLVDHVVHRSLGLVVLCVIGRVIGAVDAECQYLARTGFYGRYHHFEAGRIIGRHGVVRRLHGSIVGVLVERSHDLQAAFLQQLFSRLAILAEGLVLQNLIDHV